VKEACRFYALRRLGPNPMMIPSTRSWCSSAWTSIRLSRHHLWEMHDGQVLQAQLHALAVLPRREWNAAQKEELLAIVAVCLSRSTIFPSNSPHTGSRAAGPNSTKIQPSGRALRELLALHQWEPS